MTKWWILCHNTNLKTSSVVCSVVKNAGNIESTRDKQNTLAYKFPPTLLSHPSRFLRFPEVKYVRPETKEKLCALSTTKRNSLYI